MGKCRRGATVQRCYLHSEEADCVYVCVRLACPCSKCLFVLGGGSEGVCVLQGVEGSMSEGPQGTRLSSCPFTIS